MRKRIFRVEEMTYLSPARFQWLFDELLLLKCFLRDWSVTLESIKRNKVLHRYLSNDKRKKGRQSIFCYESNGKQVVILSTHDPETGTAKRTGSAWVMIIDARSEKPFFWFEIRRTRYFMERLLAVTRLMIDIVDHWPKCPECKADLLLVQVPFLMHMRAFTCVNKTFKHRHVKPHFLVTALPLPEPHRTMLKDRFDAFYMYRTDDAKKGNIRDYARLIRNDRNQGISRTRITEDFYGDLKHAKKGEDVYHDGAHIE